MWLDVPPIFRVPFGLTLDQLSRTMAVLVSGVGALIHIYSLGYMRDDEGKSRYFAALSLFMFAMLGIVFANNFVMLFIFWELVGFTSYVLIGHWFFRDAAADAANKAFITTRVGDFGFMTGILMIWMTTGTVVFAEIAPRMPMFGGHATFVAIVALLIFCGAAGKSAQFPLHVWLPTRRAVTLSQCFDSRRDDGGRGRLHALSRLFPFRRVGPAGDRLGGRFYRLARGGDRAAAERHQTHSRLFHAVTTWLHGDGCGSRLKPGGHVPPFYSRVF